MIYRVDFKNYINNLWKKFDNNSNNWTFNENLSQIHKYKNIIIKYDGRVKGILECLN